MGLEENCLCRRKEEVRVVHLVIVIDAALKVYMKFIRMWIEVDRNPQGTLDTCI